MDRSSPPHRLPDPVPALVVLWGCTELMLLICTVLAPYPTARILCAGWAFAVSCAPVAVILWASGAFDRESPP